MSFPYQALRPELHEIRLLILHPDKSAEAFIRGSLQTASLKKNIQFEALSYVWGNGQATEAINLEDTDFLVTHNLACALRRLRYESRPRVLWIDFICIDQSNIPERNSQVLLMGGIYTRASRVVSFLGESTLRIDRGLSWLDRYIHKRVNSGSLYWWKLEIKAFFSASARREKQTSIVLAHQGLGDLQRLVYWTRMWTFQEYHLPREEPISICGKHAFKASIPCSERLDEIQEAMEAPINDVIKGIGSLPSPIRLAYRSETGLQEFHDIEDMHGGTEPQSKRDKKRATAHWESIRDLMAWRSDVEGPSFTQRGGGSVDTPDGERRGLSTLLLETCHHRCTDPRDKVFALYGLVPAAQDAFPPDYNKPFEQVLQETTAFIMSHEVAAGIYYLFPLRENHLQDDSLPSWVPDYKRDREDAEEQCVHLCVGHSLRGDHGQNRPRVLPGLSTLSLWARYVGTCHVLFRFDTIWTEVVRKIMEVLDTKDHVLWRTIWDRTTARKRFVRACFSHSDLCDEYSVDEILYTMREICRKAVDNYRDTDCFDQLREALDCMYGRPVLLIKTQSGHGFGVSGMPVEEGDLAIYTDTAVQPFLIRKKSTDKPRTHYQLVGPAFVDGLEEEQLPNSFSNEFTSQSYEEFLVV